MIKRFPVRLRITGIALLLVFSAALILGAAGGDHRLRSLYIPMRDGVRIAVDLWLPAGLSAQQKIPALMVSTRYWRAQDIVPRTVEGDTNYETARVFNEAGYALVFVDARGTGASFGSRTYEMTVDEVKDYGQVADWIAAQPWSNHKIGSFGVSYVGNTAEMLLVNRNPAVAAAAPLFNDFNSFDHLVYPGGLFLNFYLDQWGQMVEAMDRDDICALAQVTGEKCLELKKKVRGVKPVDNDLDGILLVQAVAQHKANVHVAEAAKNFQFRDDPFGLKENTNIYSVANPSGHKREIGAAATPLFIRVGWLDAATVNGALARFRTFPNPQRVIIGPWSHGGRNDTDPFRPADFAVQPSLTDQRKEMIGFFDALLKDGAAPDRKSGITYYTLGAGTWTDTTVWPPAGFVSTDFYFAPGGALTPTRPAESGGGDSYTVDYTATTGTANRWHTNIGGGDVIYPDRADEDKKLLTYTSAPMETDVEITGHPLVTLLAGSDAEDGAFFAYLEDVSETGRVTYITEGELRGLCRPVSSRPAPYKMFGPYRTFERKDARPFVRGEIADLTFDLWATSALIKKGHRIRIAIAGADQDNFAAYPLERKKAPTVRIETNRLHPSKIVLPIRKR